MKDLETRQKDRKERAKRNAERDQPTSAETSEFDVETATKKEIVAYAKANGLNVDETQKVDDLREQVKYLDEVLDGNGE